MKGQKTVSHQPYQWIRARNYLCNSEEWYNHRRIGQRVNNQRVTVNPMEILASQEYVDPRKIENMLRLNKRELGKLFNPRFTENETIWCVYLPDFNQFLSLNGHHRIYVAQTLKLPKIPLWELLL